MFIRKKELALQPTACERYDCGAPLEICRIRDGVVSWRCSMRKCRKTAPARFSCFLTKKGNSKDDRQQLQVLHQLAWGGATTPDTNTGEGVHAQHGGGGSEAVPIGCTGPTANDLHVIT